MFIASYETANAKTDYYYNGETTVLLWEVDNRCELQDYFETPNLLKYNNTHSITVTFRVLKPDDVPTFMKENDISSLLFTTEMLPYLSLL